MKIMVTGSTGFIGSHLTKELLTAGHTIHLLIRGQNIHHCQVNQQITVFQGDILDQNSLNLAMQGCEQIYHLAALASVWNTDNSLFYETNCKGTDLLFHTALINNISKIVFSSTAGTFGPSVNKSVTEKSIRTVDFFNSYETSKFMAEERALYYNLQGLKIVTVNPTRVYGPGLLSESNPFTRLMRLYLQGKWKIMPGNGQFLGNYVFIDDVVNGLIAAMERGKPGEKYLLGGENCTYSEFFRLLSNISGKDIRLFKFPMSLLKVLAIIEVLKAKTFNQQPLITPEWVEKYKYNWGVCSTKAINDLGYSYHTLAQGMKITIDWLNAEKLIN